MAAREENILLYGLVRYVYSQMHYVCMAYIVVVLIM